MDSYEKKTQPNKDPPSPNLINKMFILDINITEYDNRTFSTYSSNVSII